MSSVLLGIFLKSAAARRSTFCINSVIIRCEFGKLLGFGALLLLTPAGWEFLPFPKHRPNHRLYPSLTHVLTKTAPPAAPAPRVDALSTVHASTKCSGRRSVVDVRPRRRCPMRDGSLRVWRTRALAQCAYARGYILGSAISRERLRVVRVNATVAHLIHAAVRLGRSLAQL